MSEQYPRSKSPFTLLLLIASLIVSTLVVISYYFLSPGIEQDLKNKIVTHLHSHNVFNTVVKVEGRDVTLSGIAENALEAQKVEKAIQGISGINEFESNIEILKKSD